jgi:hypothetical protein
MLTKIVIADGPSIYRPDGLFDLLDQFGRTVAVMVKPLGTTKPEEEAKEIANDIRTAVNSHADLLKACKLLVGTLEAVDSAHPTELWLGSEVAMAREAIAKAQEARDPSGT